MGVKRGSRSRRGPDEAIVGRGSTRNAPLGRARAGPWEPALEGGGVLTGRTGLSRRIDPVMSGRWAEGRQGGAGWEGHWSPLRKDREGPPVDFEDPVGANRYRTAPLRAEERGGPHSSAHERDERTRSQPRGCEAREGAVWMGDAVSWGRGGSSGGEDVQDGGGIGRGGPSGAPHAAHTLLAPGFVRKRLKTARRRRPGQGWATAACPHTVVAHPSGQIHQQRTTPLPPLDRLHPPATPTRLLPFFSPPATPRRTRGRA